MINPARKMPGGGKPAIYQPRPAPKSSFEPISKKPKLFEKPAKIAPKVKSGGFKPPGSDSDSDPCAHYNSGSEKDDMDHVHDFKKRFQHGQRRPAEPRGHSGKKERKPRLYKPKVYDGPSQYKRN